jgi:hypothetical protein
VKIDDLAAYLLANVNPYITAQGLATITAGQIITRNFVEPQQVVTLFLDPQAEEIEQGTMHTNYVDWKVDAYWFIARGMTEASARNATQGYAAALIACLYSHPDFFGVEGRDFFDGVEGKPDIKASKMTLLFKYEE